MCIHTVIISTAMVQSLEPDLISTWNISYITEYPDFLTKIASRWYRFFLATIPSAFLKDPQIVVIRSKFFPKVSPDASSALIAWTSILK